MYIITPSRFCADMQKREKTDDGDPNPAPMKRITVGSETGRDIPHAPDLPSSIWQIIATHVGTQRGIRAMACVCRVLSRVVADPFGWSRPLWVAVHFNDLMRGEGLAQIPEVRLRSMCTKCGHTHVHAEQFMYQIPNPFRCVQCTGGILLVAYWIESRRRWAFVLPMMRSKDVTRLYHLRGLRVVAVPGCVYNSVLADPVEFVLAPWYTEKDLPPPYPESEGKGGQIRRVVCNLGHPAILYTDRDSYNDASIYVCGICTNTYELVLSHEQLRRHHRLKRHCVVCKKRVIVECLTYWTRPCCHANPIYDTCTACLLGEDTTLYNQSKCKAPGCINIMCKECGPHCARCSFLPGA